MLDTQQCAASTDKGKQYRFIVCAVAASTIPASFLSFFLKHLISFTIYDPLFTSPSTEQQQIAASLIVSTSRRNTNLHPCSSRDLKLCQLIYSKSMVFSKFEFSTNHYSHQRLHALATSPSLHVLSSCRHCCYLS